MQCKKVIILAPFCYLIDTCDFILLMTSQNIFLNIPKKFALSISVQKTLVYKYLQNVSIIHVSNLESVQENMVEQIYYKYIILVQISFHSQSTSLQIPFGTQSAKHRLIINQRQHVHQRVTILPTG